MKQVISWLQNIRLRQIILASVLGLMFLVGQSFSYMNVALAETVKTPEGIYYKGTPDQGQIRNDAQVERAQSKLKNAADNVREKLNLDEDTPRATKDFIKSAKNKVGETAEPITGERQGYYQQTPPVREAKSNR